MEIRKVTQTDDFDAISRIYALSWKAAYKGIVSQQYLDELPETRWSDTLSSGQWDSFVVIDDGKYVGTSAICPAREEAMNGWGEIATTYLLPECFGKGYGKPLLDAAVSELVKSGHNKIYLWVLEDNVRARAFYEKNGFAPTSDKTQINVDGEDLMVIRYIYEI